MPSVAMAEPRNHVFIVDGTLSRTDDEDCLTHAGRLYTLLQSGKAAAKQTLGYHHGIQGIGMSKWINAAIGRGFNQSVTAGYGALASRYRPGDRIFLFGYSRGAYAARSIAGMIDRVGLLRREDATERRIRRAFRYYGRQERSEGAEAFTRKYTHKNIDIAFIGAWDTVKALGLPYPILSRIFPLAHEFHNPHLGPNVRAAYHALAADEDRTAYAPVLWERGGWPGTLEQAWFPGAHGDIGGERNCLIPPIPLTNLSFHWLIERAERHGLLLPENWRDAFPTDPTVPMVGARAGINRLFLIRRPRTATIGEDGQSVHPGLHDRQREVESYRPKATGLNAPNPVDTSPDGPPGSV